MADQVRTLSIRQMMDSSSYVAGAREFVAANREMTQSSATTGAALAQTQTRLSTAGDPVARLARAYDQAGTAQARFQNDLVGLNRLLETNRVSSERAGVIYAGMVQKFNMAADGADMLARGYLKLGAVIQETNQRSLEAGRAAQLAAERAAAERLTQTYREMAHAARQAQGEDVAQSRFNAFMGVNAPVSSARASAMVFEDAARESEMFAQKVAALRAQIDPASASQARLNSELAEYAVMLERAEISSVEFAQAQAMARARHDQFVSSLNRTPVNDNMPGRGGQNFNSTNLAFQLQDVAVTAPFMPWWTVMLQQGPQAAMVLSSMEKPAQGLLSAFTAMVSPTMLVTMGLIGAGAAAIQYFTNAEDKADTFSAALQKHQETLQTIRATYGSLIAESSKFGLGGKTFADASMRTDLAGLRTEARNQQAALLAQISPVRGFAGLEKLGGEQIQFKTAVESFLAEVRAGNPDVDGFNDRLDELYEKLVGRSQNPTLLFDTVDALKGMAEEAVRVTGEFEQFSAPINKFKAEVAAGKGDFLQFQRSVEDIGRANGIEDQASKLITFGAKLLEITQYVRDLETAMKRAFNDRGPNRMLLSQGTTNRADMGNLALFEAQQRVALERSRAAFDAQIAEMRARSPQERADAARATAAAQYNADETPAARRQRIELAGKQALLAAENDLRLAQEERQRASDAALTSAQYELSIAGKTVEERNRLKAAYEAEMQIREAAARAGATADEREIAAARAKAAAVADLNAQLAAQRLVENQGYQIEQLRLEAELIGASTSERARATAALQAEQQLRQQGINLLSQEAQQYIANAQAIAAARVEIERQNAAFQSMQQTGTSALSTLITGTGSFKERLKGALDQTLTWMQQMTLVNPLSNSIFRTNLPTMGDLFAGRPSIPGATSTASMMVTAGTVMINGGVTGGFPMMPGTMPQPGSLSSVLGVTNGVRPDVVNGAIVNSPTTSASMASYMAAIRSVESGGNYQALGPVTRTGDRAYGAYQIMGNNVGPWSQQALGRTMTPQELLADKAAQDAIAADQMSRNYAKFGNYSDVSSVWHSGRPLAQAQNAQDQLGTRTTDYVNRVNSEMSKMAVQTSATTKGLTTLDDSTKTLSGSFADVLGGAKLPATPTMAPNYFPPAPTAAATATTGANPLAALFGWIPKLFGFADGTDYSPGGMAWVGERGRELVNLPRGSQVVPNHKLHQLGGGGVQKVTHEHKWDVSVSGVGDAALMERMRIAAVESATAVTRNFSDNQMPERMRQIAMNPDHVGAA